MITIVAVCLGALLGALQTVTLLLMKDVRERVMRLETREMEKADRRVAVDLGATLELRPAEKFSR